MRMEKQMYSVLWVKWAQYHASSLTNRLFFGVSSVLGFPCMSFEISREATQVPRKFPWKSPRKPPKEMSIPQRPSGMQGSTGKLDDILEPQGTPEKWETARASQFQLLFVLMQFSNISDRRYHHVTLVAPKTMRRSVRGPGISDCIQAPEAARCGTSGNETKSGECFDPKKLIVFTGF